MKTTSPKKIRRPYPKNEDNLSQKLKTIYPKNEDDLTQKKDDHTQKLTLVVMEWAQLSSKKTIFGNFFFKKKSMKLNRKDKKRQFFDKNDHFFVIFSLKMH